MGKPPEQYQAQVWNQAISLDAIRFWEYGESGVGKTRFAATWPNPYFLLADPGGLMSVSDPVAYKEIKQWQDLRDVWKVFQEDHPYKTIVFDTLNEIQYLAMQHTLKTYPEIRRSYQSLPGKSDYGKSRRLS